jgi:hypothetical protein
VAAADKALYLAKKQGRNKVVQWESSPFSAPVDEQSLEEGNVA